uniref:(California timema) hypothetical protein n=1 Tax=Timema californicum TaxID=61474 RepID=A0A7R9JHN9_TIMCA|nr:unnamed protein product [Timema californicum]
MLWSFLILAAALAVANAGYLGAPAITSYAPGAYAAAPAYTQAYAAPAYHSGYASPAVAAYHGGYAAPAYAGAYHGGYAAPAYAGAYHGGYAAPALSYSAAPVVSHVSFEGLGATYGW